MGLFDFISDACSTIADAACSVTDAVGEVASTTVDIVSDAASSTVEVIGDLAGSAVDTVGDVTSSTIDFVSNTASTALDFAVENPLTTIATVTAVAATGGAALGVMAGTAAVTGVSTAGVMGFTAATTAGTATGAVTGATIAGSTGLVTSAAVIATKTTAVTTPTVMGLVGLHTAKNAGEYVIDLIKGKVTPVRGSVVYCDLTAGRKLAEHSGIYIGDNRIVHLNRHGYIEIVSPQQFISGITTGNEIYVSCEGEWPVGCDEVADFAESMVGIIRNYHVLVDNCHQFSAGCLMKDPENYNNFLWFLKDEANKRLGADNWRLWDKNYW
ncbi:lecithin retinol acyltransferase family protein [Acinetobacter schindleri]|uniref:lecithin retinol acyltransferase family protein n=1 Tax=Acinetobacter schindleri TaxID=108981 RepID=UPI00200B55CF|nr:lecithin retinol acyltransferase family protein [Acinetobacter schindleri]MCK8639471.1 lecithin retinol acyltransferase family protein [Acinetobacter schindleri]